MEITASNSGNYYPKDFMLNMCPTKYLNSNSREDELIIVHYTNDENIDFDKLFKNKDIFYNSSIRKEIPPIRACRSIK